MSSEKIHNVLFICTGNSARSIMSEAMLRQMSKGRFNAYSAGSMPSGTVNPLALRQLEQWGIPTEGLRSKSWNEFAQPQSPHMDFVFTLCDSARGEICPVWPGQPVLAHWGSPDPAAVQGSEQDRTRAFHDIAIEIRRRIELFLALPVSKLERLALQEAVERIGKST